MDFWEYLDRLSDLLQIMDYMMLVEDASNNDLMERLAKQDQILDEQTNIYLKVIINQNNEILERLNK